MASSNPLSAPIGSPNTVTIPSDFFNSSPELGVDIYPHEVNSSNPRLSLSGGANGILGASITKSIRDRNGGTFNLYLVPGGPTGVNSSITWTNIITPMSLVVIYLKRGQSKRIIMIGIVTKIEESQVWTARGVERTITVAGMDFMYYFSVFSYYEMLYFGLIQSQNITGVAGYIFGIFGGQLAGAPVTEAFQWLTYAMIGSNTTSTPLNAQAVLYNTYVTYQNMKYYLRQIFGYWFEPFDELGQVAYIPMLTDLLNSEGSWADKFVSILPWPYYEFFVITANANDYPTLSLLNGNSSASAGYGYIPQQQISVNGFDSVYPIVIGRINPLPWTSADSSGNMTSYNAQRWKALPIYDYGSTGLINSKLQYSTDEIANFFAVTTTDSRSLAQSLNISNPQVFAINYLGAYLDQNSIDNYGYKPDFVNIRWLTSIDTSNNSAVANLPYLSATLLGKLSSYATPTPFMLKGMVTIPMWPDVLPGNRFMCKPFKMSTSDPNSQYMFYIESIKHDYQFGGPSTTTLEITRGLRKIDYDNDTTMQQLLLGQSTKLNGVLQVRSDLATNPGVKFIDPSVIAKNVSTAESPYNVAKLVH